MTSSLMSVYQSHASQPNMCDILTEYTQVAYPSHFRRLILRLFPVQFAFAALSFKLTKSVLSTTSHDVPRCFRSWRTARQPLKKHIQFVNIRKWSNQWRQESMRLLLSDILSNSYIFRPVDDNRRSAPICILEEQHALLRTRTLPGRAATLQTPKDDMYHKGVLWVRMIPGNAPVSANNKRNSLSCYFVYFSDLLCQFVLVDLCLCLLLLHDVLIARYRTVLSESTDGCSCPEVWYQGDRSRSVYQSR